MDWEEIKNIRVYCKVDKARGEPQQKNLQNFNQRTLNSNTVRVETSTNTSIFWGGKKKKQKAAVETQHHLLFLFVYLKMVQLQPEL